MAVPTKSVSLISPERAAGRGTNTGCDRATNFHQLCQLCQLCQRWHNWHSSTVFGQFHARFRVQCLVSDRKVCLCTADCSDLCDTLRAEDETVCLPGESADLLVSTLGQNYD